MEAWSEEGITKVLPRYILVTTGPLESSKEENMDVTH